ncbi:hypothetical protein AB1E18_017490 [Capra hircus]
MSPPPDGSADSPRKSFPQLLPVPLAPRPFLLPGGHTAQEGIKGPEEGAQAQDSRHQDGTSGLRRPGKEPLTLQPEAMLLWLTLALLWCPTCWTLGPGGGTYFSTSRDFQTISPGFDIQVRYSSSCSEKYRDPGGITQELLLQQGEHIIRIHCSYTKYLQKSDSTFAASRDDIEKVLTGVYGQCTVQSITRISFDWNYPSN